MKTIEIKSTKNVKIKIYPHLNEKDSIYIIYLYNLDIYQNYKTKLLKQGVILKICKFDTFYKIIYRKKIRKLSDCYYQINYYDKNVKIGIKRAEALGLI